MRKAWIISMFCFLCIRLSAQVPAPKYKWPGFVQINDSVFISKTEISVRDYSEFLTLMHEFFGSFEKLEFSIPSPNSTGWMVYDSYMKGTFQVNELYSVPDTVNRQYFDKKGKSHTRGVVSSLAIISDLPIVNITREQVLLYCDVASLAYIELLKNTRRNRSWKLPTKVIYRLPTEDEWKVAANAGLDTTKFLYGRDENPIPASNSLVCRDFYDFLKTGSLMPVSTNYGYMNKLGIFNMCGNVAEMVMDSSYAFGGSFRDLKSACTVLSKRDASFPADDIGFRVVAVISK